MKVIEQRVEQFEIPPSESVCRKGYSLADAPPIVTVQVVHVVRERPSEPLRERSPEERARLRNHPLFAEGDQ